MELTGRDRQVREKARRSACAAADTSASLSAENDEQYIRKYSGGGGGVGGCQSLVGGRSYTERDGSEYM